MTEAVFADRLPRWRAWQETPWGRLRYRIVADLLAAAVERAAAAGVEVDTVRVDLDAGPLTGVGDADLVLCHSVVQYSADPAAAVRAAARRVRPGGVLSLLVTNPVQHVLRSVVRDLDPDAAAFVLDAETFPAVTFDHDVRRITWQQGTDLLAEAGCAALDRFGVLCVNHLVTDDARKHDPEWAAALERLELRLAAVDPYRDIASMWLLTARRLSPAGG